MQVILTEDVVGVGDIGETVSVRPGFARNFLIPKGFAIESNAKTANIVRHKMLQIEAKKRRMKSDAEVLAQKVRDAAVTVGLRVGKSGKVFGSLTAKDISEKLVAFGLEIDRRRVLLTAPIKKTGTHFVTIKLHPEVQAQLKIVIEKLEATKEEEEQETKATKARLDAPTEEVAAEETEQA